MAQAQLTSTSYAVLGLLALKPWTTYELTQQMHRALGQFWPRAESKLYEEPKKLVAHGLARASDDTVGRRPRTVYTITAKGRRAMAAWVPTAGAGPVIEFEQLIKVFFAEHGTKADLMANIAGVRGWVNDRSEAGAGISQAYLSGEGQFPERLPWLVLCGKFLDDMINMVDAWTEWAIAAVDEWPDDLSQAQPDLAALREIAARNDAYIARRTSETG